jgi:hypothetical protein
VRDPEVGDLHHAVAAGQQVPRLDVTVHQARPVRGMQAGGCLRDHIHDAGRIQRPAGQQPGQRRPVH